MRNSLSKQFGHLGPGLRALVLRPWYEYISHLDHAGAIRFMNYGFATSHPGLTLEPQDEPDRFCIQLYHRLVESAPIAGSTVLEVGCGRGGGADFIARYHRPTHYTGMDITRRAVNFCQKHYVQPNLEFIQGNAEDIPRAAESQDVVVNLESSHCYPRVDRFFAEVSRVLRPDGHFCYADWRPAADVAAVRHQLEALGFKELEFEELNPGVVAAIEQDNERKLRLISRHSPALLRPVFEEFAGVKDSHAFHQAFTRRERIYYRLLLQKAR